MFCVDHSFNSRLGLCVTFSQFILTSSERNTLVHSLFMISCCSSSHSLTPPLSWFQLHFQLFLLANLQLSVQLPLADFFTNSFRNRSPHSFVLLISLSLNLLILFYRHCWFSFIFHCSASSQSSFPFSSLRLFNFTSLIEIFVFFHFAICFPRKVLSMSFHLVVPCISRFSDFVVLLPFTIFDWFRLGLLSPFCPLFFVLFSCDPWLTAFLSLSFSFKSSISSFNTFVISLLLISCIALLLPNLVLIRFSHFCVAFALFASFFNRPLSRLQQPSLVLFHAVLTWNNRTSLSLARRPPLSKLLSY